MQGNEANLLISVFTNRSIDFKEWCSPFLEF